MKAPPDDLPPDEPPPPRLITSKLGLDEYPPELELEALFDCELADEPADPRITCGCGAR